MRRLGGYSPRHDFSESSLRLRAPELQVIERRRAQCYPPSRRPPQHRVDAPVASWLVAYGWSLPFCIGGASMAEQQTATCPQCSHAISPEDTIVFGHGRLGHLDCRRPRVLSAEERAVLFLYCKNHPVVECARCSGKFHLRDVVSLDQFGIRSYECPWCHIDLTDSIRAHLYGCAMLPAEVRRRAAAAREAARHLVKQSQQLRDNAEVLMREAEVLLQVNQWALRRSLRGREWPVRLLAYHPLPMKLRLGDRFSDTTGEQEIVGPPRLTADNRTVHARVRRLDPPAAVEERTWLAHDRIRVRRAD